MPEDVLRRGRVTGIGRRQRVQVVEPLEKTDLVQAPPRRLWLSLQTGPVAGAVMPSSGAPDAEWPGGCSRGNAMSLRLILVQSP
jgi:hypothetical protein